MKKSMAALSALLLGLSYCPPGAVAMAVEEPKMSLEDENLFVIESLSDEDKSLSADRMPTEKDESISADRTLAEKDENLSADQTSFDNEGSLIESLWKKITDTGEKEDLQAGADNETRQAEESEEHKTADGQASGLKNLQIPQKMGVVIDPWEMDGRGQVYSDVYVIRNTGETSGVLILSNLTCRPQEKSGVVVKTEKDGLHDSNNKYIYMEMLFGNGDQIIFSPEKSQYQAKLEPGEELSVCFTGEVNENASSKWKNQDVAISVVYSWEAEEALEGLNLEGFEEEQKNVTNGEGIYRQQQINAGGEKPADNQQPDKNEEESGDRLQPDEGGEEPTDGLQTDVSGEEPGQQMNAGMEEPEDILQTAPSIEDAGDEQKADPEEKNQESNLEDEADKKVLDTPQTDADQESISGEEPDAANSDTRQDSFIDIDAEDEKETEIVYSTEEGQADVNSEIAVEDLQTGEETEIADEEEKKEIKSIELQEPEKSDIKIDSWKTDEKGRIVSPQYVLHNAGDTTGTWVLSDFKCKLQESDEIEVMTDKKRLHEREGNSVYVELVPENGEKAALSRENSTYEVNLEPGEKLAIRFIGEVNGNLFESREEGDIVVTAVCSWNKD